MRAALPCSAGRRAVSRATTFVEPAAAFTLSGKPFFASLPSVMPFPSASREIATGLATV